MKSLGLSLAGLLAALALIVGGLTGLGRDMLPNTAWPTFDGGSDNGSVVLAPAEQRHHASTPKGAGAPLGDAALPLLPSELSGDAPTRTTAPTGTGTGGAAAPPERTVRVELDEESVGEQRVRDRSATSFRSRIDTDRDGLTDVKEQRLGTDALRRDSDGDELPDGWEARHGLNPTSIADGDGDTDGDGLRNRTEFRVKSDPRAPDTDANGRPDGTDDTDGDGLSNGVEDDMPGANPAAADTNDDGVGDGLSDQDGDGVPNATEVTQGTDLAVPDAPPAPPAPEPAPAPAPPATPAPAPAVAETPAPAASPALSSP